MMEANGDAAKQIWITEMGWSTYSGSGVTEAEQAQYLVKAYRRLESYPYVRAALQYNFRNSVARGEDPLDDHAHYGLLRIDFSRKPAYDAFKAYTPGSGFARPRGVGSTRVWLVPALERCTAPNRVHGPALAFGACTPPRPVSDHAMVGTLDRNGQPSNGAGFIRYRPRMGDPSTETDEADVAIRVNMIDVRVRGSLADYAGELEARMPVRLSDRSNGPGASETGTVQDHSFAVTRPVQYDRGHDDRRDVRHRNHRRRGLARHGEGGRPCHLGVGQIRPLRRGIRRGWQYSQRKYAVRGQGLFVP